MAKQEAYPAGYVSPKSVASADPAEVRAVEEQAARESWSQPAGQDATAATGAVEFDDAPQVTEYDHAAANSAVKARYDTGVPAPKWSTREDGPGYAEAKAEKEAVTVPVPETAAAADTKGAPVASEAKVVRPAKRATPRASRAKADTK